MNEENKTMEKTDIKSLRLEEVQAWMQSHEEPAYRAKQLYEWMHIKGVTEFAQMHNLSKSLREKLEAECVLTVLRQVEVQISKIDGTRKYLFALPDGNIIESVWMKYQHGNSVCVSSQAGCRMGCRFCASTIDGLARNLTPAEMLEQIYRIQADTGERVSNVVIMGSGEPLDNYENVVQFLRMISDENGLHISERNLTLSTCGLVPNMYRLAEEGLHVTMALSLHAPNDKMRQELMPVANKYHLEEVIGACKYYFQKTGRRITFEYSLVSGVNDSNQAAKELAKLVQSLNCHINLIPVNAIKERNFVQSEKKRIQAFQKLLENNQINVTIRREMGRDINGACGQFRKRYLEQAGEQGNVQGSV